MITKIKKVYYCEFCKKKKGLSAGAMSTHEKHCTLNPKRKCRLCKNLGVIKGTEASKGLIASIKKEYKKLMTFKSKEAGFEAIDGTYLDNFKKAMERLLEREECPMCFFSALRFSGIDWAWYHFDLKEKVAEFWKERAEEAMRAELY